MTVRATFRTVVALALAHGAAGTGMMGVQDRALETA